MPLIVTDYTWEETDKIVWITVPLKGVKPNKVDVFLSDEYLKASYPPYLFECLLVGLVDDTKGSAQIGNGTVVFKLVKKEEGLWNTLQSPDAADKNIMKQKREEAFEKIKKRLEVESAQKAETKRLNEKLAINEMMKIEDEARHRISDIKENERKKATDDLEKWKEEQRLKAEK
ncbi:unnamed protein product, partial [Candidula unifasciata]